MAIINVENGHIEFFSHDLSYRDLDKNDNNVSVPMMSAFYKNSNLLIVNPSCEKEPQSLTELRHSAFGDMTERYYIWKNKRFYNLNNNN